MAVTQARAAGAAEEEGTGSSTACRYLRAVQDRLTDFRNRKQAELTALESALGELQSQLNSQALSLSPERRSGLEKEIQRGVLELNQKRETAAREMQLEVNEAQSEFQDKLLALIHQFGEEEGFDMIIEASLVAYTKPTLDVTTALIDPSDVE